MKRDRLALLATIGLSGFALSFPLLSQPKQRVWRVALLIPSGTSTLRSAEFLKGMRELGYIEGRNFILDARFADGRQERLPELAKALVADKPDVVVAASTPAVRAARRASSTIPIVMVGVGDPVGTGLVASLSRPGGNVTGHSILTQDTSVKLLELLSAALPKLSGVAVLVNPGNPNLEVALRNISEVARKIGARVQTHRCANLAQIEAAFAAAARDRLDAILFPADPLFAVHARRIGELALQLKLPSASSDMAHLESGGLLSYGASLMESFRRAAYYVDKILKGAKPGELPVEFPTTFEFAVNLKTAHALGISVPRSLLLRADRVIE